MYSFNLSFSLRRDPIVAFNVAISNLSFSSWVPFWWRFFKELTLSWSYLKRVSSCLRSSICLVYKLSVVSDINFCFSDRNLSIFLSADSLYWLYSSSSFFKLYNDCLATVCESWMTLVYFLDPLLSWLDFLTNYPRTSCSLILFISYSYSLIFAFSYSIFFFLAANFFRSCWFSSRICSYDYCKIFLTASLYFLLPDFLPFLSFFFEWLRVSPLLVTERKFYLSLEAPQQCSR